MTDQREENSAIETRVRVLTWNIWWRFGPWESRRPAIAATLARLDADVIALQEVWSDETTNLAAELAEELGHHHVFASGMDKEGIGFGNALLSRWPITRYESTKLHGQTENDEGRLALFAEIDGPRGPLPVFNTHLNYRFDHSHIRQRQVTDLARFVDRMRPETFPPILCGDFNAEPASEEMRMLTGLTTCPVEGLVFNDAWVGAGGEAAGYTWDNANPYVGARFEQNRRIDWVLVGWPKAGGAGHIVDCRIAGNEPVGGVWPSDHFAVLAELRY
ncbi:MAG: endonuclease/exonuclease/phosphatase family protein [Alphaproteobacteria bacterium]